MAVKGKDIEALWQQYCEEGVKRGISVNQFFESNGVPYNSFEKWYKMRFSNQGIIDCVVSGSPDSLHASDEVSLESPGKEKSREVYVSHVNIVLSNGIKVEHHRLNYGDLVCFINKLQSLCLA